MYDGVQQIESKEIELYRSTQMLNAYLQYIQHALCNMSHFHSHHFICNNLSFYAYKTNMPKTKIEE